ncbi:MAG: FtsW/RodA/SpoVE family cell cycle protein [Chloroflexota bacterium]|nr:FtsW/RodA/SpoVE family cell cycle protein [Chloroflexota bacterium]
MKPQTARHESGAFTRSRQQWLLLSLAGAFIAANALALALSDSSGQGQWTALALWIGCALAGGKILNRFLPERDPILFPIVMFLSGWGLLTIVRLAPPFADRQGIWLLVSTGAMLLVAVFPHALRWMRSYRYVILAAALALMLATIAFGSNPSGFSFTPRLWLRLSGFYFQPSEIMKLVLVAFLASYLGESAAAFRIADADGSAKARGPRLLGATALISALSVVMLIWQRDLGAATLFFVVFLLMLYLTSGDWRVIAGGAVMMMAAGFVAYHLFDVVRLRVDIWLNPWPEADSRAYQIVQSLMAFSSGGLFGTGLGQGSPLYVPVAHSDFIFAALAEEWGLLGVIGLISCFAVLTLRGLSIGLRHSTSAFRRLLAIGLSTMLAAQAIMIMGGALKLIPLTGVTLPFFSYGGSSLLVSFVMIGMLIRLSSEVR